MHVKTTTFFLCLILVGMTLESRQVIAQENQVQRKYKIDELIGIALENNPSLSSSISNIDIAKGNLRTARAYPNPVFEISAAKGTSRDDGGTKAEFGITVTQPVEWPLKWLYRGKAAEEEIKVSELEKDAVQAELIFTTKQLFYSILFAKKDLEIAKENLDISRTLLSIIERRVELGESRELDLIKAKVETLKSERELIRAESNLVAVKAILNRFLGGSLEKNFDVEGELRPPSTIFSIDEIGEKVDNFNPQLKAQKIEVKRAEFSILEQKHLVVPDIFLLGFYDKEIDKTGTLTRGKPAVTNVIALNGDENGVLKLAYSIERLSEHPLAQAIVDKAKKCNLKSCGVTNFESLTGSGVKAALDGEVTYIGKPELFKELGFNFEKIRSDIEKLTQEGKTVILVGTPERIEGIIALRDEIRPQAKNIINDLHSMDIKVVMLTGDNEITASAISKEVGIDEFKANLKPEDKIKAIESLEQEYGAVAMVGDGVNDAPALARATVGIAMGTVGTDAAIEAADVALMGDDITKVSYAIRLGKRAKKIGLQNIVFSLLILIVLIPSALLGIMTVAIAVLFHEVSELLAVANGLRVARRKV